MISLLKNRILVKELEKKTDSGLIIIDKNNEVPLMGEVVICGPGRWLNDEKFERNTVQKGMRIYFGKHAGVPIVLKGERYLVMTDEDVLGIIDPLDSLLV